MSGFQEIQYDRLQRKQVGVGVLGYGFMGKVHANGYVKIPYSFDRPAAWPKLVAMCGRNKEKTADTASRFGFKGYYTTWQDMVQDPGIDVFDNCTPDNLHAEPSIAALGEGKHVICEKPLAMTVEEAKQMRDAAAGAKGKHMLCHNYRFIPAVRFARQLIEEGRIGRIYQFHARYLQEVGHDPGTSIEGTWYAAGTKSGVLLGIGCHIIDMARFLAGEIATVSGIVKTYNPRRALFGGGEETVRADEDNIALVEFESGATGTLESSGVSTGRKNRHTWEINGSKGSIAFDLEDPNHLHVCLAEGDPRLKGFTKISVTGAGFPLSTPYLPPGHNAGWEYGHVHALHHFLDCVVNEKPVEPYGASFEDGYRVQLIMDAVQQSSKTGERIVLDYN